MYPSIKHQPSPMRDKQDANLDRTETYLLSLSWQKHLGRVDTKFDMKILHYHLLLLPHQVGAGLDEAMLATVEALVNNSLYQKSS